jgi:hypothetical protein
MRKLHIVIIVLITGILNCGYSCAQNGPTPHKVVLTWTQSTSPNITGNCVYRGSKAGTYTLPALFCSTTPITTFTDTSVVSGQVWDYAVTAQQTVTGTIQESAYSNDVQVVIPGPNAPNMGPPTNAKSTPNPNSDNGGHDGLEGPTITAALGY